MKVSAVASVFAIVVLAVPTLRPASIHSEPDSIVIIVNNSVGVTSLSEAEVRRFFLKEKERWGNGDKVFPLNAKPGAKVRALFQQKVLKMTATEEQAYWQDQKIKLGKTPPPEFINIPKAVFSLKGSIGYCLRSEHKAGTSKIVLTL